jgi:hypothetical protein
VAAGRLIHITFVPFSLPRSVSEIVPQESTPGADFATGGRTPKRRLRMRVSGKLGRARSLLYRSQILQVNMRLKALAEIYTMHSFALLQNRIFNCFSEKFPKD